MPEKYPPIDRHTCESVHAAHAYNDKAIDICKTDDNLTQCCENEASSFTESRAHLPPSLPGGQEIHRDSVQGYQELRQDQVH